MFVSKILFKHFLKFKFPEVCTKSANSGGVVGVDVGWQSAESGGQRQCICDCRIVVAVMLSLVCRCVQWL